MSRLGTVVGMAIVAAGAAGVYALFHLHPSEESGEEEGAVSEATVQTGAVVRTSLRERVAAYGSIEADPGGASAPAARARITAPAAGLIAEACCVEGQAVKKGDPLFRLDSRLADLALAKARQEAEFAGRNLERQKKLLAIEGTSQKTLLEAQQVADLAARELAAAQAQRDLLVVSAPIAGTITRVSGGPGETVEAGRELGELVDLCRLVLAAAVPSRESALLRPGQPVEIWAGGADAVPGTGRVTFVDARVDPPTDSVRIRASLPEGSALRLGQAVLARIVVKDWDAVLAVPEDCLVRTEDGASALMLAQGGEAGRRTVTTGVRDRGLVAIEGEGIAEGQPIVTVGAYGLPEKAKIRIAAP